MSRMADAINKADRMSQFALTPLGNRDDRPFAKKLQVDWYFSGWFQKVLIVIGFFSLFYSIIRVIAQGWW